MCSHFIININMFTENKISDTEQHFSQPDPKLVKTSTTY